MATKLIAPKTNLDVYTALDIDALEIGMFVYDCFGSPSEVVKIFHKGTDVNGKKFACMYLKFGETSMISQSIKEGEKPDYLR